jgi:predicted permease
MTVVATVVVGAVLLLLVSACVNAGTLLLSRAMARRRDVAIRLALGATRRRLVRQLLAESLLVALGGGALGLLFAYWTTQAVPALFSPDEAELLDTGLRPLLVVLTLGVACAAGAVVGIVPAMQGTRAPASLALRSDAGAISVSGGGARIRGLLITAQLALSTLLLIVAALLTDSLARALEGDFGFGTRNVAVLSVTNPGGDCRIFDPVRGLRFQNAVAERLPKTDGVQAVGWAAVAPLSRARVRQYAIQAGARLHDRREVNVNVVTPGYFAALQIPLLEGRSFDAGDSALADRVAIVDELLARRQFGTSAVGQHLIDPDGERIKIVGVVRSGRYRTMQESPQPTVYLPLTQDYGHCGSLFVRTSGDPAAMLALLAGRIRGIDGDVSIARTTTLDQHLSAALAVDRITRTLVGICGIIALLMGAIGVYGAMADAVLRRTREIGLRVALGAGRGNVVRLVLTEAVLLTALGILAGIGASLAVERMVASFAHGLPGIDMLTLGAIPGMLIVIVALAAIVPLRRALSVNPTIALSAN